MDAAHKQWKQQITDRRNAERRNVKAALIKAGYKNVRVGHDRGTAWGWLTITVEYYGDYFENLNKIQAIAVKESGRTGRSAEDISITLNRAADDVEGARKAREAAEATDGYKTSHVVETQFENGEAVSHKLTPEQRLLRDIFGTDKPKFDLLNMKSPSKYKN